MERLVLVLAPDSISDPVIFQQWLLALVRSGLPPELRILLIDSLEAPCYTPLCNTEQKLIHTQRIELDMAGAREELSKAAGISDPGSSFRNHFLSLTNAGAKGDLAAARLSADAALAIASSHKWGAMSVVVQMSLGGAYLAAGRIEETLASYRSAGEAAKIADAEGDPAAPKLVVQSRMAEGATLVSAGRFIEAAALYEDAAAIATRTDDPLMTFECWRMASYCHEQVKSYPAAWNAGMQALHVAGTLDKEMRRGSALAYAGQGLLRIAKHSPFKNREGEVRERMSRLLDPDWEQSITSKP